MINQRDFLTGIPADPGSLNTTELAALSGVMRTQIDLLRSIRYELEKQTPSVECVTFVGNAGADDRTITDTQQHTIRFLQAGKNRTVYRLEISSTYDQTVYFAVRSMGAYFDGIPFSAGDVLLYTGVIENAYIWAPTLSASQLKVNGNSDSTHGSFNVYGFTTPDFDTILP